MVAVVAVCKRIASALRLLAGFCSAVFREGGGEAFACWDIIEENGFSPGFHGLNIVT